jgi:hypothetical protein
MCLFANPKDAKLMSWHASDEHKNDGKIRHLDDGKHWQDFNENYLDFANEPINIRFTLSTEGMNPFAETSSKHSTWRWSSPSTTLLHGWCWSESTFLLTILISRPTQSRVDMDVFLEPLMEETGVQMLDEYHKDSFMLREIVFVRSTITLFSSHYQASLREMLVA